MNDSFGLAVEFMGENSPFHKMDQAGFEPGIENSDDFFNFLRIQFHKGIFSRNYIFVVVPGMIRNRNVHRKSLFSEGRAVAFLEGPVNEFSKPTFALNVQGFGFAAIFQDLGWRVHLGNHELG